MRDKTPEELNRDADAAIDASVGTPTYYGTWDLLNSVKALQANAGLISTGALTSNMTMTAWRPRSIASCGSIR